MQQNNQPRIFLVGASGTGKSTVYRALRDLLPNVPTISNVARTLMSQGKVTLNTSSGAENQRIIFNEFIDRINEYPANHPLISERHLIDCLAYTRAMLMRLRPSDPAYRDMRIEEGEEDDLLLMYMASHPSDQFIYFPIEFPMEDDGVRSNDPIFRADTDQNIRRLLNIYTDGEYLTVTGTAEERILQVRNWLNI